MKRSVTLLAATATLVPLLSPATAHAAPAATLSVSPKTVVLTAQKSTTLTIKLKAPGLSDESWVSFDLHGPQGDYKYGGTAEDPDGDGVFVSSVRFDRYDAAGKWIVETELYDYDSGEDYVGPSASFYVKRGTRLTANAGPEPIKKGRTLKVTGKLTRLNSTYPFKYVGYKGQRVYIYFKRKGTKKWVLKGYATTNKKGVYLKKFKARHDGYWCARFKGTTLHTPVLSSGDYVDVR